MIKIHPIISTLQFFWGEKWLRSNPINHKTFWHIPNIHNSGFKSKNARLFQIPFYFSFIFLDNTSHKFWDQSPSSHNQCCLQVSGTVSWHKLRCCYSANMLQHWVRGGGWFISAEWTISEFPEIFPGIDLISIIYVRYYRYQISD